MAGIPQSRGGLFRLILAAAAFAGGSVHSHADLGLPREAYGVWDRAGGHPVSQYPYVRGQEYAAEWTAINPARNTFDWAALDSLLQLAYDQNQRFFVKIQPVSATTMPPWIFTAGVPKITCPTYTYGYYLDPEFKIYFEEMVQALGKHLREDVPPHLANIISFVRVDTGATGDEEPYEGSDVSSVPVEYQISANDWKGYRLWAFGVYDQAFQHGTGPQIPLLFQNIEVPAYRTEQDWVMANVTSGFGAKYGGQVRGHHLSESRNVPDSFKALSVDTPFRFFSVNEMDQTWEKPYFQLNLKLGMYWCAVEQLNAGMTIWDWSGSVMEGAAANDIVSTAEFFNTWAAELDPPTARGGFCIFHEGLASEDIDKFPEATYGSPVTKANTARYTAICAAYASQGAKMDDLNAATLGQVAQRRVQIGFNDSGWGIWPGNYERFITQMNPDSTSKGLWRVNGTLTTSSHPYDRFARGFDSATGRDAMYFDINDNLLPSVGQRVRLSVDYLDRGTGQFALRYDAVGNSQKTAFTVTKTNSNTWKTASVVVTDWAFGNQGPNGSDLTLVNLDSDDDIFHKLEVTKLAHVQVGTVGMGTVSARTDATFYSPVIGDDFAESQRLELSVTPATGWVFTGWSGELTGMNTRPFLFPTRDSRVTATFAQVSVSSSVDNFNSANWTGGSGWSGAWTTTGEAATPSTIAQLNGGNGIAQITRTLAAPLSAATLSFGYDLDRIGGGDVATVEVFNGDWQTVWTEILRGTDVDGSIDIVTSGNISLSGTITQVRFTLNGNGVGDTFLIDDVLITGTPNVPTSNAPLFSSDPIGEAAAPVDGLYSGTLAGNASDPNGQPLTFSKLSGGPAWLGIDANGTLSGTPLLGDLGLNRWTVEVTSSGGTDTAILLIEVIAPGPNPPAGLSYSSPPVCTKGTAIANLSPSSSGGGVMRYVATPKLPTGLRLNNTTGVISGTPVEVKAAATYAITATNADGSTTTSLNITVNDIAPSALTYTQSSAIYTKGQTIAPNTPTNSGGAVVSYAVSPPLPAGLLLNTTTGVITGTPSVLSPTATTHTVTATNTGGSTATTLSILVEEVIINSTPIAINDLAKASLYPSAIVVPTTAGTITKITATIYGLTHARQNDLDILLVGPSGQKVLLMSDVGGSASVTNADLTFDDAAVASLTTDPSSIPTGTYKPSNSRTNPDPFSAPAPAAPYDLTLSVFNGTNPTGTWSLYVMDDRSNNTGRISGGWSLSLETTAPPAAPDSLRYSSNPATYTKDTAIPDNTPTSSGGAVVSYAVSPALPAGLTLNTSTGVISGAPTNLATAANYTVTASNTGGSTTVSVSIMVNDVTPSSLSYSSNPTTYTKDTVIPDNTPTSSGGAVVSYAVSPALPAGLTLNTSTGVISGAPTTIATAADYTVTASSTGGSTTASVSITVNDIAPSSLSYSSNPATYTKDATILNNTPTSSGGAVVSYAVSPALPTGLTLNTSTGIISGAPTTLATAANYTVTASNTGGSTTASVSIMVNDVAPSSLSYSSNPASYTKDTVIPDNTPTSRGGAVVSYAVSPALPTGLTLNTSTGIISGTPTTLASAADYTVTASNTGGSTTALVSITVNDVAPFSLSYSSNPAIYTKDTVIPDNTPTSSGGAVVSYAVSPALPAGLTLNTSTGVISGTPTTLAAAADYTVTATNTGGSTTASVSITVNDFAPFSLSYSSNPASYTKDMVIPDNTPTSRGGAVVSYAVSPALPTGLTLNTSTGIISGAPTTLATAADYTVTASNTGGSTTASVSIMVNDVAPSSLSYSSNPATYTKDTVILDNTPTSSGGAVVSYAVSPVLPAGLTLNISTGVISGAPTTLATAANYTVTASNTGGSTTALVSITVNDVAPFSLSYSSNPASYTKDTAISDNTPTSSGGAVVSYAVSPALPAGLTLNTSSGVISGTPTTVAASANYTVTATNTGGSATASASITVNDIAPSSLSYSTNPASYTKDMVIPDNTPTSSGGAVVSYAVSPALPAGLTLNTSTGVISGTPTALATAADYTVTASNTGGSTTAALNLTVISAYSAWSTQYQLTQGPEGDDDGDGNSNYFEFVAHLIPTNAASVFRTTVTHVSGQANQMAIVYGPIADGRTYELKSSDSLAPGSWTALSGSISSDLGNERKIIDTEATGPKKYYRVEINYP